MNLRKPAGLFLASTPIMYFLGFTLSQGYPTNLPVAAVFTAAYAGGAYLILTPGTQERQ